MSYDQHPQHGTVELIGQLDPDPDQAYDLTRVNAVLRSAQKDELRILGLYLDFMILRPVQKDADGEFVIDRAFMATPGGFLTWLLGTSLQERRNRNFPAMAKRHKERVLKLVERKLTYARQLIELDVRVPRYVGEADPLKALQGQFVAAVESQRAKDRAVAEGGDRPSGVSSPVAGGDEAGVHPDRPSGAAGNAARC